MVPNLEKPPIVFLDDDESFQETVEILRSEAAADINFFRDPDECLKFLKHRRVRMFYCDLRLGRSSGVDVVERAREYQPDSEFRLLTSFDVTEAERQRLDQLSVPVQDKIRDLDMIAASLRQTTEVTRSTAHVLALQRRLAALQRSHSVLAGDLRYDVLRLLAKGDSHGTELEEISRDIESLTPRGLDLIECWRRARQHVQTQKRSWLWRLRRWIWGFLRPRIDEVQEM